MTIPTVKRILELERRVEDLTREYNELREAFSIMDARVRVVENRLLELEAEQAATAGAAGRPPGTDAGLIAGSVTQVTRQDSETGKPETRLILAGPTRLQ